MFPLNIQLIIKVRIYSYSLI